MKSIAIETASISLPHIDGEFSMMPFDLATLSGLTSEFQEIAHQLLKGIKHAGGIAYLTVHGKTLKKSETLRRGGAHTDGSYDPCVFSWGGQGGWKVGENGPMVESPEHKRHIKK